MRHNSLIIFASYIAILFCFCSCGTGRKPVVSYKSEIYRGILIIDEHICFFIPDHKCDWIKWNNCIENEQKAIAVFVDNLDVYKKHAIPMNVKYIPIDGKIVIGCISSDETTHENLSIIAINASVTYIDQKNRTIVKCSHCNDTIRTAFEWEGVSYQYTYIWIESDWLMSFNIISIDTARQDRIIQTKKIEICCD